jgi:N-acetylglucosamine kinase-like BadF-type ATPase
VKIITTSRHGLKEIFSEFSVPFCYDRAVEDTPIRHGGRLQLGVDVGGTSTRAVVVDGDGHCLGLGVSSAGNPTSAGPERAADAILAASRAAAEQAGASLGDVDRLVAAIAGAGGTPGVRLRESLAAAGLTVPVVYRADLLAIYCSGALAADGYAMVAGTGAIASSVRAGELAAVRDGLGWLLGDDGSGYWIGRRVVRAVIGALDGRLPATSMAAPLLARLGIAPGDDVTEYGQSRALRDAIDVLYALRPVELAAFAPLAFEAAAAGDDVAVAIVAAAGEALARTLRGVLEPEVDGPLVLGGSVLSRQPTIAGRVVEEFRLAGFRADVVTVDDGTVGAAVLALREAGVDPDEAMFERMRTTLAALRGA